MREGSRAPGIRVAAEVIAVFAGLWALMWGRFGEQMRIFFVRDDCRYLDWGRQFATDSSLETALRLFTESQGNMYRALPSLTAGPDFLLWGFDPFGWHLTTSSLHVAACTVVYFIGLHWYGDRLASALAAIFTLLFPLSVNCVLRVALREEAMCLFFYLLAVVLYLHHRRAREGEGGRVFYWASVIAASAAAFSKEIGVGVPIAILVIETIVPMEGGRRYRKLFPYLGVVGIYLCSRTLVQGGIFHGLANAQNEEYLSLGAYFADPGQALSVLATGFPRLLLVPAPLRSPHFRATLGAASLACAWGLALLSWRSRRHRRILIACGALAYGAFLPVLPNVADLGLRESEMRRFYMASAFAGLLIGGLLAGARKPTDRRGLFDGRLLRGVATTVGLALAANLARTYWRAYDWNTEAIRQDAAEAHRLVVGLAPWAENANPNSCLYFTGTDLTDAILFTNLSTDRSFGAAPIDDLGHVSYHLAPPYGNTPLTFGLDPHRFRADLLDWGGSDYLVRWDHERLVDETARISLAVAERCTIPEEIVVRWEGEELREWRAIGYPRSDSYFDCDGIRASGPGPTWIALTDQRLPAAMVREISVILAETNGAQVSGGGDGNRSWTVALRWSGPGEERALNRVLLPWMPGQAGVSFWVGETPGWMFLDSVEDLALEFIPDHFNPSSLHVERIELRGQA